MIITRLVGGLGNQMFQYATGFAVAERNKTKLSIDISWYAEKNSTVWVMGYALNCFNISAKKANPEGYKITTKMSGLNKHFGNHVLEYKEDSLLYNEAIYTQGKRVVLDGYWQSEKYFIDYRDDLLKEFSLNAPLGKEAAKTKAKIINSNAVSLHVRRGDYASHAQTNSTHGLMDLDYYQKSVNTLQKKVGDHTVFVFSDEPDWCKANLNLEMPTIYVSGNQGYEDMHLMSSCKHNIIANSSFSWWGAWLNTNKEKNVVAPAKWFADPILDSQDIVPESWYKI